MTTQAERQAQARIDALTPEPIVDVDVEWLEEAVTQMLAGNDTHSVLTGVPFSLAIVEAKLEADKDYREYAIELAQKFIWQAHDHSDEAAIDYDGAQTDFKDFVRTMVGEMIADYYEDHCEEMRKDDEYESAADAAYWGEL